MQDFFTSVTRNIPCLAPICCRILLLAIFDPSLSTTRISTKNRRYCFDLRYECYFDGWLVGAGVWSISCEERKENKSWRENHQLQRRLLVYVLYNALILGKTFSLLAEVDWNGTKLIYLLLNHYFSHLCSIN